MKTNRYGQAKVLTNEELEQLLLHFPTTRDTTVFAICYFTGCRISECITLELRDVTADFITIRKENTKGKTKTRQISINPRLRAYLDKWLEERDNEYNPYLFPSPKTPGGHISRRQVMQVLDNTCKELGLVGVSTHSFRRTSLTRMFRANVSLRTIQSISGHASLDDLQRYLEVSEEQKYSAISVL